MSENTKLYGYLIYNEPEFSIPPLSAEDVIITSANTITDIGQVVAREMKDLPNGLKMLKIIPSAASGITFTAIDIALSWSSEGPIQAIVTGVVTTGVSCAIGVVATPIIVGTSATAITTGVTSAVIGGIVSILVGKLNDGIYDFAEREIANITKNNVTGELTLNTDLTDISDIKQLVDPYVSLGNPEGQQQINRIASAQNNEETIYTIKKGDTVWDICQKYGLTYDELIDANPWLADRFSDDMEFALIKPEEQLYIPENILRGSATYNESFETVRDIYTGEKSPSDLINYEIPEDSEFYVPQGGDPQQITYQYTQAPVVDAKTLTMQMLSGLSIVTNGQVLMYLQYPQLFPQANEYMKNFAGLPSLPSVAQTMPLGIPMVNIINNLAESMMQSGSGLGYTPNINVTPWVEQLVSGVIVGQNMSTFTNPLSVDLDGDGKISLTDLDNGTNFDIDNDGFAQKISWVSGQDGILVLDRNNNGKIDNGLELFGENTVTSEGTNAKGGIDALSDLDNNNDGIIDANDAQFSSLKFLKADGTLVSLQDAGISQIILQYNEVSNADEHGNVMVKSASFVKTDGSVHKYGELLELIKDKNKVRCA